MPVLLLIGPMDRFVEQSKSLNYAFLGGKLLDGFPGRL
jgi:hypothetical protein